MTVTTQHSRLGPLHRAGWLLAFFVVAAAGLPAPRVAAAQTICVALVVDFSPLGGNVDNSCTKVPSGANGYDVLRAGGHSYTLCSNGIIGEIDRQPANGCAIKDDKHFWGYWHRKPGSTTWTFSSYGAGAYHPGEGSTEGWVWENGSTTPPANVAYPAGCHSPPPSPSPSPTHRVSTTATPAATSAPAAAGTTASRGSVRAGARPARLAPAKVRKRVPAAAPSATPSASLAAPAPVASATAPSSDRAGQRPSSKATDGGNHAAPALAGVGIAALLGGGAWWRSRRPGAA